MAELFGGRPLTSIAGKFLGKDAQKPPASGVSGECREGGQAPSLPGGRRPTEALIGGGRRKPHLRAKSPPD